MIFPQLGTGAVAQYPLVKRRVARVVSEQTQGGELTTRSDPGAQRCEWDLRYDVLTRVERDALQSFVESVEGRLYEFVFLDPLDNLLRWSSDLSQSVWTRDPQIVVSGSTITNTGQSPQTIWQAVQAPAAYLYTCGAKVSSTNNASVTTYISDGTNQVGVVTAVGTEAQQISVTGRLGSTASEMRFGFGLPPGAELTVEWTAAVAQPGIGTYQPTTDRSGVYPRTRLAQDELVWTAMGPDWFATTLKLTAWAG